MAYLCAMSAGRESTYGTAVTTGRAYEFTEEDWQLIDEDVKAEGYRSGASVARSDAVVRPVTGATGSFTTQPTSRGMGLLLEECMGAGASTLVSGTTYQQVFTLGSAALPAATWKRLVPTRAGVVTVQTFKGVVVTDFELKMDAKGVLTLSINRDAREFDAALSADALVYTIGQRFTFAGASFQTGTLTAPTTTALASATTSWAGIRSFGVKVDHKLDTDSVYTGNNAGKKDKPAPSDLAEITVTIGKEHIDSDLITAYRAGTHVALVATFVTTESLSTGAPTLQVVLPSLRPKGPLPKTDKGIIATDLTFEAFDNGSAAQPIWIVTRTSDAALA